MRLRLWAVPTFNYIQEIGGFGYEYKDAKILIFFSNDSDAIAYNKVVFIETENKKQGVLGIYPGLEALWKLIAFILNTPIVIW